MRVLVLDATTAAAAAAAAAAVAAVAGEGVAALLVIGPPLSVRVVTPRTSGDRRPEEWWELFMGCEDWWW